MSDAIKPINFDALLVGINEEFKRHGINVYSLSTEMNYGTESTEELLFMIRSGRPIGFSDLQEKTKNK